MAKPPRGRGRGRGRGGAASAPAPRAAAAPAATTAAVAPATVSTALFAWACSATDVDATVAVIKAAESSAAATAAPLVRGYTALLDISPEKAADRLAALRNYGAAAADASAKEREYAALYDPMRKLRAGIRDACLARTDKAFPFFYSQGHGLQSTGVQVPIADAAAALGVDAALLATELPRVAAVADGAAVKGTQLAEAYSILRDLDEDGVAERLRALQLVGCADGSSPPSSALEREYAALFAPLRAFREDLASRLTAVCTPPAAAAAAGGAAASAGSSGTAAAAATGGARADSGSGSAAAGSVTGSKRPRDESASAATGSITIEVVWQRRGPSRTLTVTTQPSSTLAALQDELESLTGVPTEEQIITKGGEALVDDGKTVAAHGVNDRDSVVMRQVHRSKRITLHVTMPDGDVTVVKVDDTASVAAVKRILERSHGTWVRDLWLVRGDKDFFPGRLKLDEVGVSDGTHLELRGRHMMLFVMDHNDNMVVLDVKPSITVLDVKLRLAALTGVAACDQELQRENGTLEDHVSLDSYGLTSDDTLEMSVRTHH